MQSLELETDIVRNLDEYSGFYYSMKEEYARRQKIELDLITDKREFFSSGYCYVCQSAAKFKIDFLYTDGQKVDGKPIPNWRERLECTRCRLNNRIRACIHFLEQNLAANKDSHIYISEQSTPLYLYLKQNFMNLVGSEYFGDKIPFGSTDSVTGFRNESITGLTFPDASLDFILSFDVFEHVPDYKAALGECFRCLKPGGSLLFTVPFDKGSHDTMTRAILHDGGEIEHLCEPQYHGDPINADGCLCYYTFG
ncbi:MAG: class I SAM-dependent methyltransferase, partial [Pseudohongiellaceae bacterium]